jgi:hypothetical protein
VKRRITKLVVFLFFGAVVNVAVAWGCVYLPARYHTLPQYKNGFTIHGTGFNDWWVESGGAGGFGNVSSAWTNGISTIKGVVPDEQAETILPNWARFAYPSGTYPPASDIMRLVYGRGWPCLSLWSGREVVFPTVGVTVGNSVSITKGFLFPGEGTKPFSNYADVRVLPLAPIWPGFAINTIFYAALLWMLWLSPFVIRRVIRHKRGQCIKCGYDLGGTSGGGCPECGWGREGSDQPGI